MFRLVLLLSIAAFGLALFLPVYAEKPDLLGYFALLGGWMVGANDIPTAISWLANVMYFLAFIMILKRKNPRPKAAFVFAIFAIVFGAAILGAGTAYQGYSETVGKRALGTAFYARMASFLLMAIAAWLKMKKSAIGNTNEQPLDESKS